MFVFVFVVTWIWVWVENVSVLLIYLCALESLDSFATNPPGRLASQRPNSVPGPHGQSEARNTESDWERNGARERYWWSVIFLKSCILDEDVTFSGCNGGSILSKSGLQSWPRHIPHLSQIYVTAVMETNRFSNFEDWLEIVCKTRQMSKLLLSDGL